MIQLTVNGKAVSFDGDMEMPLLWFLREDVKLKGTKYGCGIAQCGVCTVLLNGEAVRSCSLPMSAMNQAKITTIEGLAKGEQLHPVQQAWIQEDVAQCGYCQAGQIMATVVLLEKIPHPSDEEINQNMTNLCRCGSYNQMRKAIHLAASLKGAQK